MTFSCQTGHFSVEIVKGRFLNLGKNQIATMKFYLMKFYLIDCGHSLLKPLGFNKTINV